MFLTECPKWMDELHEAIVERDAAKLKAAGVPFVTTGAAPVQVAPGLKIVIVKDPNNILLELAERGPR